MTNKLLKAQEVAELLSVDPKMVFQLPIPRVRVLPNHYRFRPQDVDRYVTERLEKPGQVPGNRGRARGKKRLHDVVDIQRLLVKKMLYTIQSGQQASKRLRIGSEANPIELTEVVQEPLFSLGNLGATRKIPVN